MRFFYVRLCTYAQYVRLCTFMYVCSIYVLRTYTYVKKNSSLENSLYGKILPRQQPITARDFTGSNLCHIIINLNIFIIYLSNNLEHQRHKYFPSSEAKHSNRSCYANLQLSRTIKTIVHLYSMTCCYA